MNQVNLLFFGRIFPLIVFLSYIIRAPKTSFPYQMKSLHRVYLATSIKHFFVTAVAACPATLAGSHSYAEQIHQHFMPP